MKTIFYFGLFTLIFGTVFAQNDSALLVSPKHKIWVYGRDGITEGILISTTDSSLKIFPGKFSEWNKHPQNSVINQSYLSINKIETHKKNGAIKGTLIGAGIGLLPAIVSGIFGNGEGGAYVSVITFPVGIITGAIIGGTGKKKFYIDGQASKFHSFHKHMKY